MLATFTYMLFYFLLSQDFEIEFDAKETTFVLNFVNEILMTGYLVQCENWMTSFMPDVQKNSQHVANAVGELKKVTSDCEKASEFLFTHLVR